MWVGTKFYTPESFTHEAVKLGISKRISAVPRGLELGKTWVLIGQRQAALVENKGSLFKTKPAPGIFYAFIPRRIEKIITDEQAKDDELVEALHKRGITPVVVPSNDPDHQ